MGFVKSIFASVNTGYLVRAYAIGAAIRPIFFGILRRKRVSKGIRRLACMPIPSLPLCCFPLLSSSGTKSRR